MSFPLIEQLIFYDQNLISQVEKIAPYSTNKQALTTNARDSIYRQQSRGYDGKLVHPRAFTHRMLTSI